MVAGRLIAGVFFFIVSAFPAFCLGAHSAPAKDISGVKLQQFKDWNVYRMVEAGKKVCYIGSFPLDVSGVPMKGSPLSYVLVTAFAKGDEVSVAVAKKPTKAGIGFKVDRGSEISLYTEGNMGWAVGGETDALMISMMQRGNFLYISYVEEGAKNSGARKVAKYSLAGFTAAYKHIKSSCS